MFSSLYKSHILAIQFSNNHLIINLLSYDSSVFDQWSHEIYAQMCALVCNVQDTFFDSGRKNVAMNGILWQKWGKNLIFSFSPILMKWQMFAVVQEQTVA